MGLTGYFRSVRVARIATLVLGGTLVAAAIPAEARLSHPLRSAQRRGRYHPQVSMKEAAARDELIALVELDRVMTRIRATEAKLALLMQGRQPPIG